MFLTRTVAVNKKYVPFCTMIILRQNGSVKNGKINAENTPAGSTYSTLVQPPCRHISEGFAVAKGLS